MGNSKFVSKKFRSFKYTNQIDCYYFFSIVSKVRGPKFIGYVNDRYCCCSEKTINILTLQYSFIRIMHALHYLLQFNGIESIEMLKLGIEKNFRYFDISWSF